MRLLALIAVALIAAAVFVVPEPGQPVPAPPAATAPAPYSVCPMVESARRTTVIDVVGGEAGEVDGAVFAGGEFPVEFPVDLSPSGTGTIDVAEMTGIALAPVLLGFDDPGHRAEQALSGGGIGSAACRYGAPEPQILPGGDTGEGNVYTVHLTNPFAGSATVDILAASEVGPESDASLEGIVVPPRSVVPVELSSLLPGRRQMSAAVLTREGRVVAGARHESGDDFSVVSGLEPATDWYVAFPALEGASGSLFLYNPGTSDAPFQLDVYGPEGLLEAAREDVVPARSQLVIPAGDHLEGPGVIRVVAAAPLGAAARFSGEGGIAVVPGIPSAGPSWLLPGAGRHGASRAHVFNPGVGEAAVRILDPAGEEVVAGAVAAAAMARFDLPEGPGVVVEADAEVVVSWTTLGDGVMAGDAGRRPAE